MKRLSDESGQVVVITVLSMALLLGFLALAVDVGTLFRAKRNIQAAADSGAIAGAQERPYGNMNAAAWADAALNGVTNGASGNVVKVNNPPLSGPHTGDSDYVEVIASQSQPTFFMRVFSFASMTVAARAVATLGASQNCIYTLKPTGTDFLMNGSGNLSLPTCGIVNNSSNSQAMLLNGSINLSAKSIGIVGSYVKNGSGSITPTPVSGIVASSDPLAFLSPPSFSAGSCLANPSFNGTSPHTLGPGCYNGFTTNGSGATTLNPGLYIINGAMTLNGSGSLSGTGVTFYFPPGAGSYTDNGSSTITLSAPTSGAYDGLLFYQNPSDTNQMTFNGSSTSNLKGIFYLPKASLILNGSNSSTFYTSLVVGSLTFNGSGTLLDYAIVNGSSPLTSASLVE
jgi:hypothetical protein